MDRREFVKSFLCVPFFYATPSVISGGAWPIYRSWNFNEIIKYSQWVNQIYDVKKDGTSKQKGAKLDRIFKDDEMNLTNNPSFLEEGNVQFNDTEFFRDLTHCGSFPLLLQLYYSYRRGLPAVVSEITMKSGGDIRYSKGNHPVSWNDSVSSSESAKSFIIEVTSGKNKGYNFVSGNYRTAPNLEGTDSVPIKIDRRYLKSGALCYNANGHVLVVGRVDENGEVHFLDAHPDHSITSNQTLSTIPEIQRISNLERCYDGFRMMRLSKIKDGKARFFSNDEMKDYGFSVEQYESMELIKKGVIQIKDQKIKNFPQYVKTQLSVKKEKPLEFLASSSEELMSMFVEREIFVQDAWKEVLSNGAITFPNDSSEENIYQANGRWEIWSSPSSDIDRREKYNYIVYNLENILETYGENPSYDFSGFSSQSDLAKELLTLKKDLFSSLKFSYKNSEGEKVELNLKNIEDRLYDLSFNPNHCPELRWGAPAHSHERESMKLISTPLQTGEIIPALRIYELERGLRYYEIRQTLPSSLNPEKNPKAPPREKIDDLLLKYI